jgi:hypothetical protein
MTASNSNANPATIQSTPLKGKSAEDDLTFAHLGDTAIKPHHERRNTFFAINRSDPVHPTTIVNTPPFTESLTGFSLFKITRFIDKVKIYEAQHGFIVRMCAHCQSNVEISLRNFKQWDNTQWWNASNEAIESALQEYIRPIDDIAFRKLLREAATFKIDHRFQENSNDLINFQYLYDAVMQFQYWFARAYEFLSTARGITTNVIPRMSARNDGIISIFLSKLPKTFADNIKSSVTQAHDFVHLSDFLDLFNSKMREIYESYQRSKQVAGMLTRYEDKSKSELTRTRATHHSVPENSGRDNNLHKERNVHAIYQSDNNEEDEFWPNDNDDLPESSNSLGDQQEDSDGEQAVLAIEPSKDKPKEKKTYGCFQMAAFGQCKSQYCKSSHKETDVAAAAHYWLSVFENSKYNVTRKPNLARTLNHIYDICATTCKKNYDMQKRVLTPVTVNVGTWSASLLNVLLDTGSMEQSVISADFVNRHRAVLASNIIPIGEMCKIGGALEGPSSQISEMLTATITILDQFNVPQEEEIHFLVVPGLKKDMIIGAIDMMNNFNSLFRHRMDKDADIHTIDISGDVKHTSESTPTSYTDSFPFPWSILDPESPEELDTPDPQSFSWHLHYMEVTVEEARDTYLRNISEHISPEARAHGRLEAILKSDLAISVFVPSNWEGVLMEPFELDFAENMPMEIKPRARPVNPKLYENAKSEFQRLCKYMYTTSNSPIASPLVIAPKKTQPYIRFCGDYVIINNYILAIQYPIPSVKHALQRIAAAKFLLDLDVTNAFHQRRLGRKTSNWLSIQTPWGLVRPLYMPEGIKPASAELQRMMDRIFSDMYEFMIVIFDNMLVLCESLDDAADKLNLVLVRCREFNLFLKYEKSYFGYSEREFFGYMCKSGSFQLTDQRKEEIMSWQLPRTQKQAQSFMGCCLIFQDFVPNYAQHAAPLYEMSHKNFDWNQVNWKRDYLQDFENFKVLLVEASALYYPDYELDWILSSDASDYAVGGALSMIIPETKTQPSKRFPLGFFSQKLSPTATRWTVIEKELYGIYATVRYFAYILRAKSFIVETDHRNLLWMENSDVPKIIRWRIFLQSFDLTLKHVAGKDNIIADHLSRLPSHLIDINALEAANDTNNPTPEELLTQVHNSRMGHNGVARTWKLLTEHFPGHQISQAFIRAWISACATCQVDRLGMTNQLDPIYRHIRQTDLRQTVGADVLSVTPPDKNGMCAIIVIVNLMSKMVALYPTKSHSAIDFATALFQYFCTYGGFQYLAHDPGSDIMSETVQHLNKFLGIRSKVSLVNRHESNGVEPYNKEILKHLRNIVYDEDVRDKWSDPTILPVIALTINSFDSSGCGYTPLQIQFGIADAEHFKLPNLGLSSMDHNDWNNYITKLNEGITMVRTAASKTQATLREKRLALNDGKPQTSYQKGEYVLRYVSTSFTKNARKHKLDMLWHGPYVVQSQYSNDVTVTHLSTGKTYEFHVTELKLFVGDEQSAKLAADKDAQQYSVTHITAYNGNVLKISTLYFQLHYTDGDVLWIPYSKDLDDNILFQQFIQATPQLFKLKFSSQTEAQKAINVINKTPISEVKFGDTAFLNIRFLSADDTEEWYEQLGLPDCFTIQYVVKLVYGDLNKKKTHIQASIPILKETFPRFSHSEVRMWGMNFHLTSHMCLIDSEYFNNHPTIAQMLINH